MAVAGEAEYEHRLVGMMEAAYCGGFVVHMFYVVRVVSCIYW